MNFSSDSFERAQTFLHTHARSLDQCLWAYYCGTGSAEAVLRELARYQNPDGGFGHALEPDFRLTASSPMATSVGLQYAHAVEANAHHALIIGAVEYLQRTYEPTHGYWPATFPDVNAEPHAPWWHLDNLSAPDEATWPNPSAELIGYLHAYAERVDPAFLAQVTQRAHQNLQVSDPTPNLYNLMCWQRALPHLPLELQTEVRVYLQTLIGQLRPLTPEKLGEVQVYWLAPSPQAPFAQLAPEEVHDLLEWEIVQQAADGGWWPRWQWGQYPEVWAIARQEWAGKLTVDCLRALQLFGKYAGQPAHAGDGATLCSAPRPIPNVGRHKTTMHLLETLKKMLWGKSDPDKLIALLEDRSLSTEDRQEITDYLINYYEPKVVEALVRVAVDPSTEDDLADSCGEALGTMMVKNNDLKIETLRRLNGIALDLATGTILNWKPEWKAVLEENGFIK